MFRSDHQKSALMIILTTSTLKNQTIVTLAQDFATMEFNKIHFRNVPPLLVLGDAAEENCYVLISDLLMVRIPNRIRKPPTTWYPERY